MATKKKLALATLISLAILSTATGVIAMQCSECNSFILPDPDGGPGEEVGICWGPGNLRCYEIFPDCFTFPSCQDDFPVY